MVQSSERSKKNLWDTLWNPKGQQPGVRSAKRGLGESMRGAGRNKALTPPTSPSGSSAK